MHLILNSLFNRGNHEILEQIDWLFFFVYKLRHDLVHHSFVVSRRVVTKKGDLLGLMTDDEIDKLFEACSVSQLPTRLPPSINDKWEL